MCGAFRMRGGADKGEEGWEGGRKGRRKGGDGACVYRQLSGPYRVLVDFLSMIHSSCVPSLPSSLLSPFPIPLRAWARPSK